MSQQEDVRVGSRRGSALIPQGAPHSLGWADRESQQHQTMVSHGNYSLTWSTDRGQNTELRGNSAACKLKDGLDSLFALLLLVPSSRIHSSVNWRLDTMTFRLFGGFVLNIYHFYVAFATRLSAFKRIIFRIERDSSAQPKIKTVSSIAHPHVVPNPFDFLLLNTKDVRLYVKVWQSQSPLTFIAYFSPYTMKVNGDWEKESFTDLKSTTGWVNGSDFEFLE